jgi:hypothetical protein
MNYYVSLALGLLRAPFSRLGNVRDKPKVKEARQWYFDTFKPKTGISYDIALKYAEDNDKELKDSFAALDKKAEWFYGVAIVAMSAVYFMAPEKTVCRLVTWGLPSLALSAIAFVSLMRTKIPGARPGGLDIKGAIDCVESQDNPSAVISANLHCATKELAEVNEWKAKQITSASYALVLAFFLAPLVLCAPPKSATTSLKAGYSLPGTFGYQDGPKVGVSIAARPRVPIEVPAQGLPREHQSLLESPEE